MAKAEGKAEAPKAEAKGNASEPENIKVKFVKAFAAKTGAGIVGSKGDVKTYPATAQLADLINDGILEVVERMPRVAKRETG